MTLALRVFVPWLEVAETKVTRVGSVLVSVTALAANGPWFVTSTVRSRLLVCVTGFGEAKSDTARSAAGTTVVMAVAVLSTGLISWPLAETVVVLVIWPTLLGVTRMLTVARPRTGRFPRSQLITPPENTQLPCELETELNVTPAGRESDKVTPLASVTRLVLALVTTNV